MRVAALLFTAAIFTSACAVGEVDAEPAPASEQTPETQPGNEPGGGDPLPLPGAGEANQGSPAEANAPTTGVDPTEDANVDVSANYALRTIGRVTTDTNLVTWPGPVLEISFSGTGGKIALTAARGAVAVRLDVDGEAQPTVVLKATPTLVPFGPLAAKPHTVRLTKLSEAYIGTLRLGEVKTDGHAAALAVSKRRILFVGDSITAGFGVLGTAPCTNDTTTQDVTSAYPGLVAKALGADATVLAWSGMGLLRNLNPTVVVPPLTMTAYWRRQNATQATPNFVPSAESAPQVVVVALGTNDFRAQATIDHDALVDAYVAFVEQIATAYPGAKFVLSASPLLADAATTGPTALRTNLLTDLARVVARVGNKAKLANVPALSAALRSGCGGHPNEAGQQVIADVVVTAVKQQAGW